MTRSRQTADWGSRAGLAKIVPSSVAVGSGTGSADSLGTVTFTTASSVSLNGCFSSTYQNYRIMFNITAVTADNLIRVKLRKSGTDNSSTAYINGGTGITTGGVTAAIYHTATTAGWILGECDLGNNLPYYSISLDFFKPFDTSQTVGNSLVSSITSGGEFYSQFSSNFHTVSDSYDGMSFIATAGNITGKVSVYGYN